MWGRSFKEGDQIVYRKRKHSVCPGPRARDIEAAAKGESYSYMVDKFWVVVSVQDDGKLVLATRRGKTHVVDSRDPNLRRARIWERIRFGQRFPQPSA